MRCQLLITMQMHVIKFYVTIVIRYFVWPHATQTKSYNYRSRHFIFNLSDRKHTDHKVFFILKGKGDHSHV